MGGWFATGVVFLLAAAAAPANARAPTVEDLLSQEGHGGARFSPNGKWLAINLIPRYSSLADYSFGLSAFGESGHQVWVADLSRSSRLYRLDDLDANRTSHIVGFSPSSEYLVVIQYYLGEYNFAACELSTARCRRYAPVPDLFSRYSFATAWNFRLIWTSNETFLFPTISAGSSSAPTRNRAAVGRMLWQEWNKAWRGAGSTASEVISTGRSRAGEWADGSLSEFDVGAGRVRTVVRGRFAGARLSPDRKRLIGAREGVRERPSPRTRPASLHETRPVFDRRFSLRMIDPRAGHEQELSTPFNVDPSSLAWSEDSRNFAVFGWDEGRTSASGRFYIVSAQTGEWQVPELHELVLANRWNSPDLDYVFAGPARAVLMNDGLIVFARPRTSDRYDWYYVRKGKRAKNLTRSLEGVSHSPTHAGRSAFVIQADGGLYRIGLGTASTEPQRIVRGVVKDLAQGVDDSGSLTFRPEFYDTREEFSASSQFLVRDGDRAKIVFVDHARPDAKPAEFVMSVEPGDVLAASPAAAKSVVAAKGGFTTRFELHGLVDRRVTPLAVMNDHLFSVQNPKLVEIDHTLIDPRGVLSPRAMRACLQLPADYEAGKRYPLVVEVYPGSRRGCQQSVRRSAIEQRHLWSARGFLYALASMPLDLIRGEASPIEGMDEVLEQTIRALVEQGPVDPDRVVLTGFSQGGIAALYIATQASGIAAVIASNSWADFLSHYFGGRGLYRYQHLGEYDADDRWRYECAGTGENHYCPFGFGLTPFEAAAEYAHSSPVTLAHRINAPVMLVHSDLDYFGMHQFDEMFGALSRAGKEVRYVRYWGEGHGPSSPDNIRDLWARIDEFLAAAGIEGGPASD